MKKEIKDYIVPIVFVAVALFILIICIVNGLTAFKWLWKRSKEFFFWSFLLRISFVII